jgi:hypothetical protein
MISERVMPPIVGRIEDMEAQSAVLINNGYWSGQGERLQTVGKRIMLNKLIN